MKQKIGWISLVLFLAMLVPGTLVFAQEGQEEQDPFLKMMEDGWRIVAPGVMQRQQEENKVETFAVGPEGLRWTIKQLQSRLAYLTKEYQAYPSEELRQAIAGYRKQIARFRRELRTAKAESLESALEKAGCSVSYSSYANATWLTNVAGVTANSSADFNNTCGYSAETYAEAYARATKNGVTDTFTETAGPRYGAVISASAIATIQGNSNCESSSYSYARLSSQNIFLTFSALNSGQCPTPANPPSVTMTGPTYVSFQYSSSACSIKTWSASVSGGVSPYTYQWKYNGTVVGTGSSYSRSVCPSSGDFTITVTITDSAAQQATASRTVSVEVIGSTTGCSVSGDKAIPTNSCL